MFTGIIQGIGKVKQVARKGRLLSYSIEVPEDMQNALTGASIAIDGACQTVVEAKNGELSFEAVESTLGKTTLGKIRSGSRVHLEPALAMGDRLDGHLVLGHVDAVASVVSVKKIEGAWLVRFRVPERMAKYLIEGGSACLSGVSLTIFDVSGAQASVSLIPETLERTLFKELRTGSELNYEADVLGKWVERLGFDGLTSRLDKWVKAGL